MIYGVIILLGSIFLMSNAMGNEISDPENVKPQFKKYDHLFKKYANQYGLNWLMLRRISWIESRVGTDARTSKGEVSFDGLSWGLMQIAPHVGSPKEIKLKGSPTISELNDPDFSIHLAAKLIRYLSDEFKSERDIVKAYNQGERNQKRFLELEAQGSLLDSQYPAARDYWNKYQQAKKEVG